MTTLRQKLNLIVELIDGVDKKGRNDAQNYDFVRAIDVTRAVREALVLHGVYAAISIDRQVTTVIPRGDKPAMILSDVAGSVTFYDVETEEKIVINAVGQGNDFGGDKATPKAITSLIKYALRSAFLIPDETTDPEITRPDERELPRPGSLAGSIPPPPPPPPLSHPLASDTIKAKLRAQARTKGLDGDNFKAFMTGVTGKASSKDLTVGDVDKALASLADPETVEFYGTAKVG